MNYCTNSSHFTYIKLKIRSKAIKLGLNKIQEEEYIITYISNYMYFCYIVTVPIPTWYTLQMMSTWRYKIHNIQTEANYNIT